MPLQVVCDNCGKVHTFVASQELARARGWTPETPVTSYVRPFPTYQCDECGYAARDAAQAALAARKDLYRNARAAASQIIASFSEGE